MQLSEHLALAEVTKSGTAKRLGIDNNPTPEHLANLKLVAEKIFMHSTPLLWNPGMVRRA